MVKKICARCGNKFKVIGDFVTCGACRTPLPATHGGCSRFKDETAALRPSKGKSGQGTTRRKW